MQTWGITYQSVLDRIAFGPAEDQAVPDTTTITSMIQEVSGEVNVALRAGGQDPTAITSTVDPDHYYECRGKVLGQVVAQWRWANQLDTETAAEDRAAYTAWLLSLRDRPRKHEGETGGVSRPFAVAETTAQASAAGRASSRT